ncbi:MAG: peptidoglycan editing factor PgeF [Anaerolineales bacterium]|nr:MAG: peptidoglycan editing factor PgeF [Anaerolineales bacterium]
MIRQRVEGVTYYRFERLAEVVELVHAAFTRLGGVSKEPYATLNLGHSVGDDHAAVEENHRRALHSLGVAPGTPVSPYQVHGARVAVVTHAHLGTVQPATDALVTREPGVPLLLRFADCTPVILWDTGGGGVGLAHVGRRGVTEGTARAAVEAMTERLGSDPARIWAGIGPAIGACCYKVQPDDAAAVEAACPPGSDVVRRVGGSTHVDMPRAVEAQLRAAGVQQVESARLCTACHVDEFFSHRAERGRTGRFGVLIEIRE